jgi:hypothetical protein
MDHLLDFLFYIVYRYSLFNQLVKCISTLHRFQKEALLSPITWRFVVKYPFSQHRAFIRGRPRGGIPARSRTGARTSGAVSRRPPASEGADAAKYSNFFDKFDKKILTNL